MIIWKYMDLEKFMDLIISKTLFFCKPSRFEDKKEGRAFSFLEKLFKEFRESKSYDLIKDPKGFISESHEIEEIFSILSTQMCSIFKNNPHPKTDLLEEYFEKFKSVYINKNFEEIGRLNTLNNDLINPDNPDIRITYLLDQMYVSCWHYNKHENNAMWKQYGNKGLAIVTTPKKLLSSLARYKDQVIHKLVDYIDLTKRESFNDKIENLRNESVEQILFYKDVSYIHENEYRFLIPNQYLVEFEDIPDEYKPGARLPLSNFDFIEKIVISPYANSILEEILQKIKEDYQLNAPIA